tara:strand:+ start:2051 stop:2437 length:387 start_codon:yes stop_codon:yes gene_type:complete
MRDTYSKGDIMAWDEAEYNYFMSLDDMTKVYYLHDYLYGEFGEEYEEDFEDTPMFEEDAFEEQSQHITTKINVILDLEHLWITCPNHKMMDDTIKMFVMDGLILELEDSFEDTRQYRVIKHGSPLSLN